MAEGAIISPVCFNKTRLMLLVLWISVNLSLPVWRGIVMIRHDLFFRPWGKL